MTRVDEILAIIDTGLQTAGDTAYGDDWPDTCWRCGKEVDTDLCDECRTVLLDETTAPAYTSPFDAQLTPPGSQLREAIERLNNSFNQLSLAARRRILEPLGRHPPHTGTLHRSNDRITNQGATSECSTNQTTT